MIMTINSKTDKWLLYFQTQFIRMHNHFGSFHSFSYTFFYFKNANFQCVKKLTRVNESELMCDSNFHPWKQLTTNICYLSARSRNSSDAISIISRLNLSSLSPASANHELVLPRTGLTSIAVPKPKLRVALLLLQVFSLLLHFCTNVMLQLLSSNFSVYE